MKRVEHITVGPHTFTLISETRLQTAHGATYLGLSGQKQPLAVVWRAPAGQTHLLAIDEHRIDRNEVRDLVQAR